MAQGLVGKILPCYKSELLSEATMSTLVSLSAVDPVFIDYIYSELTSFNINCGSYELPKRIHAFRLSYANKKGVSSNRHIFGSAQSFISGETRHLAERLHFLQTKGSMLTDLKKSGNCSVQRLLLSTPKNFIGCMCFR